MNLQNGLSKLMKLNAVAHNLKVIPIPFFNVRNRNWNLVYQITLLGVKA